MNDKEPNLGLNEGLFKMVQDILNIRFVLDIRRHERNTETQ